MHRAQPAAAWAEGLPLLEYHPAPPDVLQVRISSRMARRRYHMWDPAERHHFVAGSELRPEGRATAQVLDRS